MALLPLVFPCFAIALSMGLAEDVGIWDEVVDLTNTLSFLAFEDEAVVVATLLRGVLPCLCAQRSLEKVRAANKSVAISNVFFIFNIIFNFQFSIGRRPAKPPYHKPRVHGQCREESIMPSHHVKPFAQRCLVVHRGLSLLHIQRHDTFHPP